MEGKNLSSIRISLLMVVLLFNKSLLLSGSSNFYNVSNSAFELVQTPSKTQIPLGQIITVELKITPNVINEIKEVLLFGCLTGSNDSCSLYPINMEKIEESSSFKYSWKPKSTNSLIKYRFITFYTNGSPFCFPNSLDYEKYPETIKNESDSDLYYFTVKMISYQPPFMNIHQVTLLVFMLSIPVIGIIIGSYTIKRKRKIN